MKLNIGCGFNKLEGYVNVDSWPGCEPDEVFDAESPRWPWENESVEEVFFCHSLEHMGESTAVYLNIWREVYRVLIPGGRVRIHCPHPLSDGQLGDPTHVRAISAASLLLLSRDRCEEFRQKGWPNTPLAMMLGVDFVLEKVEMIPHPRWGKIAPVEVLQRMGLVEFNVFDEQRFELVKK